MYYSVTVIAIRRAIEARAPGTKAEYSELQMGKPIPLSYLLWMLDQIQKMSTKSIDDAVRASRWMGWIFAHLEMAGFWENTETRSFVREDRKQGFDKPH
ncbi:MAG: hypothetical protein WAX85_02670 [Minisyncoccia bacterium]